MSDTSSKGWVTKLLSPLSEHCECLGLEARVKLWLKLIMDRNSRCFCDKIYIMHAKIMIMS